MSKTVQEKPVQRVIRLVINLMVIAIVGIAAFLAWDRFLQNEDPATDVNEAPVAEAAATQEEVPQAENPVSFRDTPGCQSDDQYSNPSACGCYYLHCGYWRQPV